MQLRFTDLDRHLKQALGPLYVIHGDEPLLALEAAQAIREAARAQGYLEREVLTVEPGFSWSSLLEASQSVSLFAEQKILELRIPNGKPGKEGGEVLQRFAASLPEATITLITLPKLDRTAQQAKWFTALTDAGHHLQSTTPSRQELPLWLAARLARQQQQATDEALAYLADRVEGNLLAAHQEIQKLGLLYPGETITLPHLQEAVANVARYDAFQLGEALLKGDAPRFTRMLQGLQGEGESPILVLWAITEETRTLYRLGLGRARGVPLPQLFKDCRVWGDKQRLMEPALNRVRGPQLRAALQHCARIDRLIKGIGQGDPWDELLQLGLGLMGKTILPPMTQTP